MSHVLETAAGVPSSGPLAEALTMRGKLMELTQASYEAALLPSDAREPARQLKSGAGMSYGENLPASRADTALC